MNDLGVIYDSQKRYELAIKMFLKAAENGDEDAVLNIGLMYEDRDMYNEAKEWYKKFAELGNQKALKKYNELKDKYQILERYNIMKENLYNYNMEIYCENNQEKKKLLNRYSRFQLIEHEFKDTVKRYTIIAKTDLKNIKYSSIYFYRYFINEVKKLFSPLELEYENNVITIINKKELLKKLIDETYNFFLKYPNKIEEMNSILNDMKKGLEYENFEQEIDEESIYPYIFKINLFLDKEEKILKSKSPEIISEYNVPTIINYLIKGIHRNKIKIFFDEKLDEEEVSFEEIKFELKKELNISESEFFDFNFTIKGYYIYNVSTDTVEKIEVDK